MSQTLEGKSAATYDTARLGRMAAWGAIFTPFAHVWYNQLDKLIPGPGATLVVKKVVADQVSNYSPSPSLFHGPIVFGGVTLPRYIFCCASERLNAPTIRT